RIARDHRPARRVSCPRCACRGTVGGRLVTSLRPTRRPISTPAAALPSTVSRHREGLAWALIGVALFSFSVPLTKVAVGGFSPFLTATGRAVIAGVLAGLLLLGRRVPLPPREQLTPILFTMVGAVFGWPILIALALQRTTSAHAAVIAAFM